MSRSIKQLVFYDAVELSRLIRERQVSCREVMSTYLDQIDQYNDKVNAIVSLQARDTLLEQADARDYELAGGMWHGVLHGFPLAVKDMALTKGIRTTLGSPIFREHIPAQDTLFVERMKASGGIIIGKTNVPEFALGSQTYNQVFGSTRNAYDQTKTAGGSSGGAAVGLALRMLPVADGSDMMGSLRNPAAFNNILGFRPSPGRVPLGPVPEVFYQQFFVDGPLGRTAGDVALLLSVQAGYDERSPLSLKDDPSLFLTPLKRDLKGIRIGWLGDFEGYLAVEPGVLELCKRALNDFQTIGCAVEEARLGFAPERLWNTWLTMRAFLVAGSLRQHYHDPSKRAVMKPEAIWEVERGMSLSAADVYEAAVDRTAWYLHVCELFKDFDYLVMPTAAVFPFDVTTPWPAVISGRSMDTYHRWMEAVIPATLAGLPAISVPAGFSADGLPTGLQIIGKPQADLAVLQLAHAYEQVTGWVEKQKPALLRE